MLDAHLNINIFDGIVFVVLFLSALLSFFRGFIREVLSLGAWIGAAMITLFFAKDLAQALLPYLKTGLAATIFATMGTYFLSLTTISIFNSILARYIKKGSDVGHLDNILGMLFGIFKGGLIITLGYFLMTLIWGENQEKYPEVVKTAYTKPAVEKCNNIFKKLMPAYIMKPLMPEQKTEEKPLLDEKTELKDKPQETDNTASPASKNQEDAAFQQLMDGIMSPSTDKPADSAQ
jgi:membrane protein required for colicin V production